MALHGASPWLVADDDENGWWLTMTRVKER